MAFCTLVSSIVREPKAKLNRAGYSGIAASFEMRSEKAGSPPLPLNPISVAFLIGWVT